MSKGVSKSYYGRILGTFWRHPRSAGLSLAAAGAWAKLMSWSADFRADGRIPRKVLGQILGRTGWKSPVSELISCGMLEEIDADFVQLRNWKKHNITKAQHEEHLEKNREKVEKSRGKAIEKPVTETERERASNRLRNTSPSDQDQDQDQDQDVETLRVSAPRVAASVGRERWPTDDDVETEETEETLLRKGYAKRYQREANDAWMTSAFDGRWVKRAADWCRLQKDPKAAVERFLDGAFTDVPGRGGEPDRWRVERWPWRWIAEDPGRTAARGEVARVRAVSAGQGKGLDVTGRTELEDREAVAYERAKGRVLGTWHEPPKPWEASHVERAIAKGWDPVADARAERGEAA